MKLQFSFLLCNSSIIPHTTTISGFKNMYIYITSRRVPDSSLGIVRDSVADKAAVLCRIHLSKLAQSSAPAIWQGQHCATEEMEGPLHSLTPRSIKPIRNSAELLSPNIHINCLDLRSTSLTFFKLAARSSSQPRLNYYVLAALACPGLYLQRP